MWIRTCDGSVINSSCIMQLDAEKVVSGYVVVARLGSNFVAVSLRNRPLEKAIAMEFINRLLSAHIDSERVGGCKIFDCNMTLDRMMNNVKEQVNVHPQ